MILIAFLPGYFIRMLTTVLSVKTFPGIGTIIADLQWYLEVMKNISFASLLFITLIGFVFLIRYVLVHGKEKEYSSTWGCGYLVPNERMQYTGKSFSKSFGKLLNFMLIEKKRYTEIERNETFPFHENTVHFISIFLKTK